MKIKFHGAVGTVTGSCYELYEPSEKIRFLVDCGMQQGVTNATEWNGRQFAFDPGSLDFVVLTHAHLDHCGLIPLLYKRGFRGPVYCTAETAALARIVLQNAAKFNRLYSQQDIHQIRWKEHSKRVLGRYLQGKGNVYFRYLRSAHILGATSVEFSWGAADEGKKILFSGDIGNNREGEEFQPLLRHAVCPEPAESTKTYVVIESTCGGKITPSAAQSFESRQGQLLNHIEETVFQKEGTLVIPCFAVNRTQEVLFDLHYLFTQDYRLAEVPVYFDAVMASKVNNVYAAMLGRTENEDTGGEQLMWLNDRLFEWMDLDADDPADRALLISLLQVMLVEDMPLPSGLSEHPSWAVRQWCRIWQSASIWHQMPEHVGGPCIVITGGGMCSGGPVVSYLRELVGDPRHTVLLTGYCCASTNGGKLRALANKPIEERANLNGALRCEKGPDIPQARVMADIRTITGYSGHTDHDGLINWFFPKRAGRAEPAAYTLFLTHGSDRARKILEEALLIEAASLNGERDEEKAALRVELPTTDDGWFDLDAGEWLSERQASANLEILSDLRARASEDEIPTPARKKSAVMA